MDAAATTLNPARCLTCNYLLDGLPAGHCPECSRPFDPARSETINRGRDPGPLVRFLLTPPGAPLIGSAAAVLAGTAFGSSGPMLELPLSLQLLAVATGGIYALRVAACALCAWDTRQNRRVITERPIRWLAPAILLSIALVLHQSGGVSGLRFRLSQPSLERFADAALAAPGTPIQTTARIGLYRFSNISRHGGAISFPMTAYGLVSKPHLIYCPAGPPQRGDLPPGYIYALPLREGHGKWYVAWRFVY